MTKKGGVTFSLIVLFCIFCTQVQSLQIYVSSEKCISEELGIDVLFVGTYSTTEPIGVRVFGPGDNVVWSDVFSRQGSFAFTTDRVGIYTVCFTADATNPSERTVTFDFKIGVEAKDYDKIALKEDLTPIELELRKMEDVISDINKHMEYMKQREAAMRNTNESTNSRVMLLSFLSLIVLVTLGLGQIVYLKSFFASKRLI